jgi:hypothetical protein
MIFQGRARLSVDQPTIPEALLARITLVVPFHHYDELFSDGLKVISITIFAVAGKLACGELDLSEKIRIRE